MTLVPEIDLLDSVRTNVKSVESLLHGEIGSAANDDLGLPAKARSVASEGWDPFAVWVARVRDPRNLDLKSEA
jgi:hypothetical protein